MFRRVAAGVRRGVLALALAWLWIGAPAAAEARTAEPGAVLYRIFLRDGSTLVSFGEFAHVADRVVFSIPIGGTDTHPVLHVLTLAAADVDWEKTNAYVAAARAQRYAATRGEADFAKVTRDVADTLYQAGLVDEPAKRLALVEAARQTLIDWPQQHHGYRAEEIAQMTTWLDQVVSEFRVAAGRSSFELALVARPSGAVPPVPLLPAPDLQERTQFALAAASRAADPGERVSLLRAVLDSLQPDAPAGSWMADARARASTELEREIRIDQAYAALAKRTLARAAPLARRADVRSLETLVRTVIEQDKSLQQARPAAFAGLLAALDAKIDSARRLRLARDAWVLRTSLIHRYWGQIREGLDRLISVRLWLADVRQLAGPSPGALRRLTYEAEWAGHHFSRVQPPAEVAAAHATLATAARMAARAGRTRVDALRSSSMDMAWEASSAAAGALNLLDQAVADLRRITREPAPAGVPR
jgi:hypothetical protein